MILNQSKGKISCINDTILTKLDLHQRIIETCAYYNSSIPFFGYLVIVLDGFDGQKEEGHGENYIFRLRRGYDSRRAVVSNW